MMNKRPNSIVMNVRMPLTDFASIVSAFRRVYPSQVWGISAYAREGLCEYARLLRDSGLADTFEDGDAAQEFLITEGVRGQLRGLRVNADPRGVIPEGYGVDAEPKVHSALDTTTTEGAPITPEDVLRKLKGDIDEE